jgi:hypothetical protein
MSGASSSNPNNTGNNNNEAPESATTTDDVADIVLEMIGRTTDFPVTVRKVPVGIGDRIKLVVDLPVTVGAEEANLTAALVLDELDRLPPQARIAGILISSLQFTKEGADGLQGFLASHAAHIRHVALHDMLVEVTSANSKAVAETVPRVVQVCQAFREAPLQVLDLSRNVILGSTMWKTWETAQTLEQIILDGVTMDKEAWLALKTTFVWDRLDDLHMVLNKGPSDAESVDAACSILRQCTKLSSLRWIQRSAIGGALPCQGLKEMARNMLKVNTRGGSLRHLVLGGSYFPTSPNARKEDILQLREWKDLCAALLDMPRLRSLKLRSLGLTEVERLVTILHTSRPPLEVLDLSYNMLSDVKALLDFVKIPKLNKELRSIVLSHNLIDTKQGRDLFATFGEYPVDLALDNNKVDFGGLIRNYHQDLRALERDRDELRFQAEQHLVHGQAEMGAELSSVKAENKRLREERDTLVKAFNLMGTVKHVEENKKLLDRVQRLEDMVVLGAVFKPASERNSDRRNLERRGSRRVLVGELPLQMERLRSVSQRSLASSAGANRSNRSHSNRSHSTAEMTDDMVPESPTVRSSSRTSSPAPAGALASTRSSNHSSGSAGPVSPILFKSGDQRSMYRRMSSDRRILTRQLSREDLEAVPSAGSSPGNVGLRGTPRRTRTSLDDLEDVDEDRDH